MNLLKIVKELEGKSSYDRFSAIIKHLDNSDIPYDIHYYDTGSNIIVGNTNKKFIGIGSHFDVVKGSPGANDNASSVAVALGLIERLHSKPLDNVNYVFYFFDEEEVGRKGSRTYVADNGVQFMNSFINLEMVGMGDRLALWSLDHESQGEALAALELVAAENKIPCARYDKIVGRYADHVSFRNAGIKDSFSLTCVTQEDIDISYHYYKAKEFDVDKEVLEEILSKSPLLRHYHKPTDLSVHLSEDTLHIVEELVFKTLSKLST